MFTLCYLGGNTAGRGDAAAMSGIRRGLSKTSMKSAYRIHSISANVNATCPTAGRAAKVALVAKLSSRARRSSYARLVQLEVGIDAEHLINAPGQPVGLLEDNPQVALPVFRVQIRIGKQDFGECFDGSQRCLENVPCSGR